MTEFSSNEPTPPANSSGFDFNHPTIISLLYLASFVVGVSGLVGVVLAFVWKGDNPGSWEESHYQYLINTFWLGLAGSIIGIILSVILIGILVLAAVAVLVVVRCVMSLLAAQKRQPMPNPGSWTI